MCTIETRTNFFPFKKSPKPGCVLNSGAYYIREYTVYIYIRVYIYTYLFIYITHFALKYGFCVH